MRHLDRPLWTVIKLTSCLAADVRAIWLSEHLQARLG
jgi:hypothetical protein